jgi:branched-chain amino acid transport system permease protein
MFKSDLERLERNLGALLQYPARTAAIFLAVAAAVALGLTVLNLPVGLVVVGAAVGLGSVILGRTKLLLIAFFVVALAVLPFVVQDQYWLRVTITIGIYAILALGLNVIVGYAGVLDLGFIAFYGVGAYTAALLMLKCGWSFWAALPVATAAGALLGVLRGLPTLRLSGDYLAIVTLGFGEIVRLTFTNWVDLTNGPMGLRGIEAPSIGSFSFGFDAVRGGYTRYYFLVLVLLAVAVYVVYRLRHSRPGRALLAIRDNETAAAAMGIHLSRYKALAYAVGAAFGGAAGAFFVSFNLFFPELMRFLADFRYLLFGALMVAVAVFRPRGLLKA